MKMGQIYTNGLGTFWNEEGEKMEIPINFKFIIENLETVGDVKRLEDEVGE